PARKIRAGLRTRAVDNRSFTLVHDSGRTGGQSSGIINLRMEAAAGRAVTERHVAGLVHRDATHPAITGVGRIRALLENRRCVPGGAKLVPANAPARPGGHAVVNN